MNYMDVIGKKPEGEALRECYYGDCPLHDTHAGLPEPLATCDARFCEIMIILYKIRGGNMLEDFENKSELDVLRELARMTEIVVPYIEATINNPVIGDRREWFEIHAGRADSSRNQLRILRELGKLAESKRE